MNHNEQGLGHGAGINNMKQKTAKNPKGSGAPKKDETKPIFIRVPKVDHPELDKRCRLLVSSFYNNA